MDKALLAKLCELKDKGERLALVTIVATRGSTPRKSGAAMLVTPDGKVFGSIGGGCGEDEARRQALTALDAGRSYLHTIYLTNAVAADEGMACGGTMEVFIRVIGWGGVFA